MNVAVEAVSTERIRRLISSNEWSNLDADNKRSFLACAKFSSELYVGMVDGKAVCIWGLMPPTIVSDQAYLWLHVLDTLQGYEFIFIRRSQLVVQGMLQSYPTIVGHCQIGNHKAQRWLKWLGAKFSQASNGFIPFVIVRTDDQPS